MDDDDLGWEGLIPLDPFPCERSLSAGGVPNPATEPAEEK